MRPGTSRCCAIRKPSPSSPSSASRAEARRPRRRSRCAREHPEVRVRVLHGRDVAHDVHARRVGRDDEHRRAPVRRRVGIGHRHHDQEVRDRSVRREPLVPVEDPAVAVAHARVRSCVGSEPGVSGSVIENADCSSPASSGWSQRSFCSGRPGEREDLAVAGVGRLAAEGVRREDRRAEDLVHQPELHLAEALSAELRR